MWVNREKDTTAKPKTARLKKTTARVKPKKVRTYKRSVFFAKIAVPYNAVVAVGKILLGIFSMSLFLLINAFFNIGIALAKYCALKVYNETSVSDESFEVKKAKQYSCYATVGIIILVTSVLYMLYCIKMFVSDEVTEYPMVIALGIATVTFTELFFAIRGIVTTKRDKTPLIEALKFVNLSSSLISLVLTQSAILSFAEEQNMSFFNGISGMVFGGLSVLIGLAMLLHVAVLSKRNAPHTLEDEHWTKKADKT